ncbi:hypothetical protein BU046_12785 [Staphylococcus simulans]|nr:hypothetical protein BU046_12785 [Staphylococcus simulans]
MKSKKMPLLDKILMFISLILFILNILILYGLIHVQKNISNLLLAFIMLILSYTFYKRQNKIVGLIFIIISLAFLVSFLIALR